MLQNDYFIKKQQDYEFQYHLTPNFSKSKKKDYPFIDVPFPERKKSKTNKKGFDKKKALEEAPKYDKGEMQSFRNFFNM